MLDMLIFALAIIHAIMLGGVFWCYANKKPHSKKSHNKKPHNKAPRIIYNTIRHRLETAYLTGRESLLDILKSTFGGLDVDMHHRNDTTWLVKLIKLNGRWSLEYVHWKTFNVNPLLPLGFTYLVLQDTCIVIAVTPELFEGIKSSISPFVVEFFSQRAVDNEHYPNVYLVAGEANLYLDLPNRSGQVSIITLLNGH